MLVLSIDYNNLAMRNLFTKNIDLNTESPDFPLWRYVVFNKIYKLLYKFPNVDEVVIAVDDKNSWRKSYFPRYKESRKKQRKKTDVDWGIIYDVMDGFMKDLKHYMPFKVLKIKNSEADDIIGIICKHINADHIVYSNDEDFSQLISNRVKVWKPKEGYRKKISIENFIVKKCLTGQSKDDIFNIKTPNDWGLTEETQGKRKPGFGVKSAEKVMAGDYKKWLEDNDLCDNFHRNRVLMDFDYIPDTIKKRILQGYDNASFPPPKNMYEFFKKHNMRGFLDEFSKVENKLLKLY